MLPEGFNSWDELVGYAADHPSLRTDVVPFLTALQNLVDGLGLSGDDADRLMVDVILQHGGWPSDFGLENPKPEKPGDDRGEQSFAECMKTSLTARRLMEAESQPEPAAPTTPDLGAVPEGVLKVIRRTRAIEYLVCPHCQSEIYERSTYQDERGIERHNACRGAICGIEDDSPVSPVWRPIVRG